MQPERRPVGNGLHDLLERAVREQLDHDHRTGGLRSGPAEGDRQGGSAHEDGAEHGDDRDPEEVAPHGLQHVTAKTTANHRPVPFMEDQQSKHARWTG